MAVTKTIPAAPATITGAVNVCAAVSSAAPLTYTASAVSGADSLHWTVPANATILSGWGTNTISVLFSPAYTTGSITIQSCVVCGRSTAKALAVTKTIPAAPATITGTVNVCGATSSATPVTYTASAVSGADSLHWTVPANATILSGWGTNTISVLFSSAYTTGSIKVQSCVVCGRSTAKTLAVTKTISSQPGVINGPTNICSYIKSGDVANYSVASISGADSLHWTVPSNASIVSGWGTNSIDVRFAGTFSSGNLSVQSKVVCGSSAFRTLLLTKVPAVIGLSGLSNVCNEVANSIPVNYSVASVSGADSLHWTIPANARILSGWGTKSITVIFSPTTSTGSLIKVAAVSSCASSPLLSITLVTCHSAVFDENNQPTEATDNMFSELYPNPTSNEFTIDVTTDKSLEIIEEIYDILGNILKHEKYQLTDGTNLITTKIEEYRKGIYFVRILGNQNNLLYIHKVIKQ